MNLSTQKRLSSEILKVGKDRVYFDQTRLEDIKEALTKEDIRGLIKDRVIQKKPQTGVSKSRFRKKLVQKRKGRKQGQGTRKGKRTARLSRKSNWMIHVRAQRNLIKELKNKKVIDSTKYRELYNKVKGGFFRSKRHIKLYLGGEK
ncbi:MAG: 50S ribosomal protein L19e [Candidatus Nanoarchaeia archaeon]|jgi:large subunit ribosomal protein L19e|nr:50S ribosomal protein L19e [Candidatus Nanoarchaeia archaeon]|tara:strand:- start:11652 stop:12089 length:438 start_codon:yes stop_codon:yes gene_type:complete